MIYTRPCQRLKIHVWNTDDVPHSLHVHGLRYGIDSDGSWPFGTEAAHHGGRSDAICPGQTWTYTFDVPDERAGRVAVPRPHASHVQQDRPGPVRRHRRARSVRSSAAPLPLSVGAAAADLPRHRAPRDAAGARATRRCRRSSRSTTTRSIALAPHIHARRLKADTRLHPEHTPATSSRSSRSRSWRCRDASSTPITCQSSST